MDEIHLLGEDRGPVLEVIVSRMRYIAASAARGNDSSGQRQVRAAEACCTVFEDRGCSQGLHFLSAKKKLTDGVSHHCNSVVVTRSF